MDRILCNGCKSDTTDHSIIIETIDGQTVIDLCQDCATIAQLTTNGRIDPERVKTSWLML